MVDIQADSEMMKQEVETSQPARSTDTNDPHLVLGIKQEIDSESKHNIQSQIPFLAEKIKQEQMQMCIKSEEITTFEDLYRKVTKIDSFDEPGLAKVEQPDLCGEDVGRHIKNEMCASTWSYFTYSHTDVKKMESSDSGQYSQPVGLNTVSEKLSENINIEKTTGDVGEGLEKLLVHVRKIVKKTGGVVEDLEWIPEHIHFENNIGDNAGSFQMMQVHTENTIMKTENKTRDLFLTSRNQRLNFSVEVKQCQVVIEDIMSKITQNVNRQFLNNGDSRKLSGNVLCISKEGTKHNVSNAGSNKLYVCGKVFITCGSLSSHERKHKVAKPYKCDVCDKNFTQTSHLNAHTKIHTGEKPYKCDVCGKGFTQTSHLNGHKKIHTGEKPYKCDVCGKGFTQACKLNGHKIIHTGEKPYKCDVCCKGFTQTSNLNAHKIIHTGEKPYKCDVCGKKFTRTGDLNAHKRIHTGEKPYKCDICCKGFTKNSRLYAHKRKHTKEKPYKCDVYEKGYKQGYSLNAHKRIHTREKPYKCDVCGKGLTRIGDPNAYKRILKGESPYKCDACCKGFTVISHLYAHKRETLQVRCL